MENNKCKITFEYGNTIMICEHKHGIETNLDELLYMFQGMLKSAGYYVDGILEVVEKHYE